ncbi:MAG: DUF11 domain-containing protein [Planctomycetes bacterium]|nr:DUF11 domain-containing protein [Planctomycetota bacterium]
MRQARISVSATSADPLAGRWLLIALAVLTLSSCRGIDPTRLSSLPSDATATTAPSADREVRQGDSARLAISDTEPARGASPLVAGVAYAAQRQPDVAHAAVASTGVGCPPAVPQMMIHAGPAYPPGCWAPPACCPAPSDCPPGVRCGSWTPPGLPCPWPEDEYLCDGGDRQPAVRVRNDRAVAGLDLEDTVVHYDTEDGVTQVEPSNRVCLYAPRFAAVRKVFGVRQHELHERIAGVQQPVPPAGVDDVQIATTAVQPVQPRLNLGTRTPSQFLERTPPSSLENRVGLIGAHGSLLPFEDFRIIRSGIMDNSEKARLAARIEAAMAWSHDQAVQVVIDNIATHEDTGLAATDSLHLFSLMGKPRLQVCKIASRTEARPGETVDFTVRFDNVGDQDLSNVTVIDNLTTRLEYVEGSENCTLNAKFSVAENSGDSLTLRWEIAEPIKVGEGGVIRFTCRVR